MKNLKHLKHFNESKKLQFIVKDGQVLLNGKLVGIEGGFGRNINDNVLPGAKYHTYYLIYKGEEDEPDEVIEEIDFYTSRGNYEYEIAKAIAENGYKSGYRLISSEEHQFRWANKNY